MQVRIELRGPIACGKSLLQRALVETIKQEWEIVSTAFWPLEAGVEIYVLNLEKRQ